MLGTISILLRGIPFIYQGQEIGMVNCRMSDVNEYDDIDTYHQYQAALDAGCSKEEALEACCRHSRDNARTPMQWDDSVSAGFTDGTPWIKVNENCREINVASQEKDPNSVLNYYRKLIRLKKDPKWREVFAQGEFIPFLEKDEQIFAFARRAETSQAVVLANFGTREQTVDLKRELGTAADQMLLANTERKLEIGETKVTLHPCDVVVLSVK